MIVPPSNTLDEQGKRRRIVALSRRYTFWLSSLRPRCSGPRTGKGRMTQSSRQLAGPRDYELLTADLDPPDFAGSACGPGTLGLSDIACFHSALVRRISLTRSLRMAATTSSGSGASGGKRMVLSAIS